LPNVGRAVKSYHFSLNLQKKVSRKTGNWGEKIAVKYLQNRAVTILETNWRSGHNELDIIGMDQNTLVFFEVKVRKIGGASDVIDAVDKKQFHRLAKAASAYMQTHHHDGEIRFDLIGITYLDQKNFKTQHFRDIFFPA